MAAPVTLSQWRHHVNRPDPHPPPRLTVTQLHRLTPTARDDYDEQRLRWSGADVVFDTRDIQDLSLAVTIAARRNAVDSVVARRGVAVSGPSTMGKTTAVLHIGRTYEAWARRRRSGTVSFQPVAYIVVPPGATPKMMLGAFARFLALPIRQSATSDTLADQCAAVLIDLGTTMIIIDEVHNLNSNRQAGVEAASSLKIFGDRLNATFVYAGISLPDTDLFTGQIGQQLAGRVVMHTMSPSRNRTIAQRREWAELVDLCDQLVVLARHERGALNRHTDYLHERTGGSIGSLRALVADATARAILTGTENLSRRTLDQTPVDHQADTRHRPEPLTDSSRRPRSHHQ